MITIKDLSYSYGPLKALDGVSFSLPTGKVVGLLGPNGSGKSTLCLCLAGMLDRKGSSGEIKISGAKHNPQQNRFIVPGKAFNSTFLTLTDIGPVVAFLTKIYERTSSAVGNPYFNTIALLAKGPVLSDNCRFCE